MADECTHNDWSVVYIKFIEYLFSFPAKRRKRNNHEILASNKISQ